MTDHLSHPKYRPDIDGLRAIAVLSVVAFHAFPSWVKGGFIGVDVFFVISGFLISTIIFENLEKETFSFGEFYSRRIRRIFPALLLVLTVSYVLGWFTLLADEYKQLGKHIVGGAGFLSNFVLWKEAGYFDNASETKPLLHLWSLGIEEQFYIFYPFMLWLAWKRKFNLITVVLIIALASFILNVKGVKVDPIATFYSPQTRFWELMFGGVLAWGTLYKPEWLPSLKDRLDRWLTIVLYRKPREFDGKNLSNVISIFGLTLLLFGFFRIEKGLSFPGKWALVPVLGAVLIILAGQQAWVNRKILSNRLLVWFGLISFPLYLWHWVGLSFSRILEGDTPSRETRVFMVVVSVILAWLTYKFIETPIRTGGNNKVKTSILLLCMTLIGGVGYVTYRLGGIPERDISQKFITYSKSIEVTERKSECFEIPFAYKKDGEWFCNLGDKNNPTLIFAYGDSHALSMVPALEFFAKQNNVNIQFTGTSGCPSLLGVQSMRGDADIEKNNCQKLNERVFDHVRKSKIKFVLLINRWVYYTGSQSRPSETNLISRNPTGIVNKESSTSDFAWAVKNTVEQWEKIGVKVLFIEDNPQQLHEPKDILRKGRAVDANYIKFSVDYKEHIENQALVNSILRGQNATAINFDDILCDKDRCPLVSRSRFLYSDDDHLSIEGARLISTKLSAELKKTLN